MLVELAGIETAEGQEADDRQDAAEEDRELEADDPHGRNRGEVLAGDLDRPVHRHPDLNAESRNHADRPPIRVKARTFEGVGSSASSISGKGAGE